MVAVRGAAHPPSGSQALAATVGEIAPDAHCAICSARQQHAASHFVQVVQRRHRHRRLCCMRRVTCRPESTERPCGGRAGGALPLH